MLQALDTPSRKTQVNERISTRNMELASAQRLGNQVPLFFANAPGGRIRSSSHTCVAPTPYMRRFCVLQPSNASKVSVVASCGEKVCVALPAPASVRRTQRVP